MESAISGYAICVWIMNISGLNKHKYLNEDKDKVYLYIKYVEIPYVRVIFPYCDKKITLLWSRCSSAPEEMNELVGPPIKPTSPVSKIIVHTIILGES